MLFEILTHKSFSFVPAKNALLCSTLQSWKLIELCKSVSVSQDFYWILKLYSTHLALYFCNICKLTRLSLKKYFNSLSLSDHTKLFLCHRRLCETFLMYTVAFPMSKMARCSLKKRKWIFLHFTWSITCQTDTDLKDNVISVVLQWVSVRLLFVFRNTKLTVKKVNFSVCCV